MTLWPRGTYMKDRTPTPWDAEEERQFKRAIVGVLLVFFTAMWLILGAVLVFAQENPRLKEIAIEKQMQEQRFERAKLEQENARYRYKELVEEEQKILAETKAQEPKK